MTYPNLLKRIRKDVLIYLFIAYILFDSLFLSSAIGFISISIFVIYALSHFRKPQVSCQTFILALALLLIALVVNSLGDSPEFEVVVKKLADWSYLLMILGVIQILVPTKK